MESLTQLGLWSALVSALLLLARIRRLERKFSRWETTVLGLEDSLSRMNLDETLSSFQRVIDSYSEGQIRQNAAKGRGLAVVNESPEGPKGA